MLYLFYTCNGARLHITISYDRVYSLLGLLTAMDWDATKIEFPSRTLHYLHMSPYIFSSNTVPQSYPVS
jgi:hypothetical protein